MPYVAVLPIQDIPGAGRPESSASRTAEHVLKYTRRQFKRQLPIAFRINGGDCASYTVKETAFLVRGRNIGRISIWRAKSDTRKSNHFRQDGAFAAHAREMPAHMEPESYNTLMWMFGCALLIARSPPASTSRI